MFSKMYKKDEKTKYHIIENGIILPRKMVENGPLWGLGGVCSSDGEYVEAASYHGGWTDQGGKYDFDDEIDYIDETVVYFGLFFKHWGHFLVDLIPRLWFTCTDDYNKNMKVVHIGEDSIGGNYLEFFKYANVDSSQLIHVTKPTRFKKVIFPEYSCRPCIWYSDEYTHLFDTVIKNALMSYDVKPSFTDLSKIYFSRGRFNKGGEFGENLLEKSLVKAGYKVLYPEKLSVQDQIYIWNNADEICCINGSIPLNLILSTNKQLKLSIINKTSHLHLNMYYFIFIRQIDYKFIDAYSEPIKNYPKSLGSGPFLMTPTHEFEHFVGIKTNFVQKYFDYIINYMRSIIFIINPKYKLYLLIKRIAGGFKF